MADTESTRAPDTDAVEAERVKLWKQNRELKSSLDAEKAFTGIIRNYAQLVIDDARSEDSEGRLHSISMIHLDQALCGNYEALTNPTPQDTAQPDDGQGEAVAWMYDKYGEGHQFHTSRNRGHYGPRWTETPLYGSRSQPTRTQNDGDLLSRFKPSWELSFEGWEENEWQVHNVSGGRSDREWSLIGSGESAADAINAAVKSQERG